jgi:hypothetical protein
MTKAYETDKIIGYDTSESASDLSIVCSDCHQESDGGEILHEGDEWGGIVPDCSRCGGAIIGLTHVFE